MKWIPMYSLRAQAPSLEMAGLWMLLLACMPAPVAQRMADRPELRSQELPVGFLAVWKMFPPVRRLAGSGSGSFSAPGEDAGWTINYPTSTEGTIGFNRTTGDFTGRVINTDYPPGAPSTWGLAVAHLTDTGLPGTNYDNLVAAIDRNKIVTVPSSYDVTKSTGAVFPARTLSGTNKCYVMARVMYDNTQSLGATARATWAGASADLARIRMVSTGTLSQTFKMEESANASHYRFWGICFTAADSSDNGNSGDLFRLFYTQSVRGTHVAFRQCVVTTDISGTRRSRNLIASDADFFSFEDGELSGAYTDDSTETHCLVMLQGGPYQIQNNLIRYGQIGVLLGGSPPASGNPGCHDMVFRRNYVHLPQGAPNPMGNQWKNRIEIKICIRWLVTGNVFDGSWTTGQAGTLCHFTRSLGAAAEPDPLQQTLDGIFWYNEGLRGNRAIQITGVTGPAGGAINYRQTRLSIKHNIFHRMREGDAASYAAARVVQFLIAVADVEMVQNTFDYPTGSDGAATYEWGATYTGIPAVACENPFVRDNIFHRGTNGWRASGTTQGITTVTAFSAGTITWTNNLFYGDTSSPTQYDNGAAYVNFLEATRSAIGFGDLTAPTVPADFVIAAGQYAAGGARDADDGRQMGATPSLVIAATAGVAS